MEEITKSSYILNDLLLNERNFYLDCPYAILVHTSIINKVENTLNDTLTNTDWEMCEHILQIGNERFEMKLIYVLRANEDQEKFVRALVIDSQFAFPWEKNPTLFIDAAKFQIMERFINRNNLEAFILKIEEKRGYFIGDDHPIKVVSFNQSVSVKLDIINEFKKYRYGKNQGYLFVTNAFPWQKYNLLRRIRFNDNIYSVLPIILRHLGTFNYANDLNILDLLSLRLAISDVRDPSNSNLLSYEIDFFIKRILASLIKINHLSIRKYLIVKNIKPTGLLIPYLVYEFQYLFQTIDINLTYEFIRNRSFPLRDTIKLKEEIDVPNKLRERFNVNYCIDGKGFANMSLSLFVDLIESQNVYEIVLDTNYRWRNSLLIFKHNRIIPGHKETRVNIDLRGKNTYNFIEDFTAEFKSIKLVNNRIILNINCNLNDYRIFDNLKVYKIIFRNIKIDLAMLQNLQQCAKKPSILLINCSLESTSRNWQLINNSERLGLVSIYEDAGTWWLSMFEFILEEIHKSNTNEFQFNSKARFTIKEPRPLRGSIDSNSIKFAVDEQKSKLEIRCAYTNKVIDLYCRKYNIQQEQKPDYEFYQ